MLAVALTKQMSPEKLVAANTWSLEQPIESILRKRDKHRQSRRQKSTEGEEGAAGATTVE